MNCYSCKGLALKPIMLAHDLPARQCGECNGLHLDLLNYRLWRDKRNPKPVEPLSSSDIVAVDNKKALLCQRCSRQMKKFQISTDHDNSVDLCLFCDDVWLDHGEWELLEYLKLQKKLTHIMTEPWQISLKYAGKDSMLDSELTELLGDENFRKLKTFVDWVDGHEQQDDLLDYIRTRYPY